MPKPFELRDALRNHPELAGLFLLVDDPLALERELRGRDRDLLASLFLIHCDRGDANDLAAALPGNAALIADLYRRGLVGAEVLFLFGRETLAAREYETWLRGILQAAIGRTDEQLVGTFLMLLEEGPKIRTRMNDDAFRVRFPGLWAKLDRAATQRGDDLGLYVDQPGLWEFLTEPEAEVLIAEYGLLPVDLLYGEKPYPKEYHARVKALVRTGDGPIADLLLLCRGEPAFYPFLRAELPPDLLRGIYADLSSPAHKGLLRPRLVILQQKLAQSQDRLREAVSLKSAGPKEYLPFYSVYKVYQAYADGEETSTLDLAFAAADIASVALPAARGLTAAAKAGATATAKEGLKAVVRQEAAALLKGKARRETATRLGTVAANRYAVRLAVKQRLVVTVKNLTAAFRGRVPTLEARVDVTEPLAYVYRHAGIARDPLRKLMAFDPRILVSGGGRVFLNLRWSEGIVLKRQRHLYVLRTLVEGRNAEERPVDPRPSSGESANPKAPITTNSRPSGPRPSPSWEAQAGSLWLASAADLLSDAPERPTDRPGL